MSTRPQQRSGPSGVVGRRGDGIRGDVLAVVPQVPYVMLQRGGDHVGALLPHHEVPAGRPPLHQQRPLHPVQGEAPPEPPHGGRGCAEHGRMDF